MNCCKVMHGVFSFINLLLLVVTTASPFWMAHYHDAGDVHMGLWFSCPKATCGYLAILTANLNMARAMQIIALGSCVIALMSSMKLLTWLLKQKISENLISSMANFITGFFVLSTSVVMYFRLRFLNDTGVVQLVPNWAFALSGIVCSLSFMLGVLSLLLDSAQENLGAQMDPTQVKEPTLVDYMEPPI